MAEKKELQNMKDKGVWELVPRNGQTTLSTLWNYTWKLDDKGEQVKAKGRSTEIRGRLH
jgi:hypothetical protein